MAAKDVEMEPETVTKTETVHFRISGVDLTRIIRERLLEDAPGHAWRIATCLNGEGVADAALKVLQGKAKLVGNESNMRVVDERVDEQGVPRSAKTRAYLEGVRDLYAGRIRVQDKWYRPVAYVSDMGPRDMKNSHGKSVHRTHNMMGYTNRAWHYCGNDEIVIDNVAYDGHDGLEREVIFRTCGERPHWQSVPITAQAALQEFLDADRHLEERSHSKWYGTTADEIWEDADDEEFEANAKAVSDLTEHERCAMRDEESERVRIAAEDAEEEAADKRREEDRQQQMQLRERILAQAGSDLIDLTWAAALYTEQDEAWGQGKAGTVKCAGGSAKVPRAPFMHWAFSRLLRFNDKLPPWATISPSGMKMVNDDRNHTDWVIGAGFDPQDRNLYSGPIHEAALTLASELQDKFDRPAVHVLVDGPFASGPIVHGKPNTPVPIGSIVVLPNLRPHYLATIEDAAAVITENGGEGAHLAQIGRERTLPIVRIPDARKMFEEGHNVVVDTASRTVEGM
jgi:phosphohistidine swiveling domain-containing protein